LGSARFAGFAFAFITARIVTLFSSQRARNRLLPLVLTNELDV
jgi:hypothetical protein